ncbi:MAG TPA: preprotein translocase subunit YajC [Verrucomicrobiae bacterium]|nr:preprotein translocase subunit YajC [Verrucomicrobiae bacterium]
MNSEILSAILAFAPPAKPGEAAPPVWTSLVPLVLLVVVFYFALIRPQQKRAREQADLVKNLRPGDKVVTSSGIVGVVVTIKEKTMTLRSADTKMEITKGAVTEVTERSGSAES